MTMNTMPTEYREVIDAYRRGATADFLQAKIRGRWGPFWTVPGCSSDAMERAGRQFARCRAEAVRHCRRARLTSRSGIMRDVVIVTVLPSRSQDIRTLETGTVVRVRFLSDHVLDALIRTMNFPPHVLKEL